MLSLVEVGAGSGPDIADVADSAADLDILRVAVVAGRLATVAGYAESVPLLRLVSVTHLLTAAEAASYAVAPDAIILIK